MSGIIKRRPLANQDLIEAADYLQQASPRAATRLLTAAEKTFEFLAEMPDRGSPWESDNPKTAGIRFFHIKGFPKHLVFYRPLPGGVDIIRVLHSSRDLQAIFEKD
jgi:toxin ParE1/3/4